MSKQQECKMICHREHINHGEHCERTPQQDTDLEERAGENPYANGKQQDTWEKRFDDLFTHTLQDDDEKLFNWDADAGKVKDFIAQQKQLSEQQGYQRGLQEVNEYFEIKDFGSTDEDTDYAIKKIVNTIQQELRKKLAEKKE